MNEKDATSRRRHHRTVAVEKSLRHSNDEMKTEPSMRMLVNADIDIEQRPKEREIQAAQSAFKKKKAKLKRNEM
jgi:hypothetical protein